MTTLVLLGVLVLAIGGCVCVVWAERGGPRWVRVVATVTRIAGEVLRSAGKHQSRSLHRSSSDGDQGIGSAGGALQVGAGAGDS
ncbi:hypothetical protein [Streptomyces sp. NPDC058773]|uniref:hypothetical protein n=1 Tax=Streptomyces sp. NPDC058773 TaxID=3346632 RepID=UPI0036BC7CA4